MLKEITKQINTDMKTTMIIRSGVAAALIFLAGTVQAQFNTSPTLKIGDAAPAFKVKTWLRGEQVKQFEKGKVYVIDFWATWCGGCIASFPHISAIGEKYKDKVSFSSVSVYEAIDSSKVDPVTKVTQFLKTPRGQNLKLSVAVDDTDNSMWDAWIKPLRRAGLPTTYVIDQEGKIAWLDVNLDHLDWVLQQVLAKTWNREKAAAAMQAKDALEDKMISLYRDQSKDKTKGFQEMLNMALAFEQQYPDRKDAVAFGKFWALAELDKTKIPALLEEMAANPLSRYINLSDAYGLTLRRKDLTKRDYTAVAKVQERCLQNEHPGTGFGGKSMKAYEELAATYNKAGNTVKAVSSIEKAIAMAQTEKVAPEQIKKLKATLSKYKAPKKSKNS